MILGSYLNYCRKDEETLACQEFIKEIENRATKGDKREILYLLAEGLDSSSQALRQTLLDLLVTKSKNLNIFSFDLLNIKCHTRILKYLSSRNPLEYKEDFLKSCILLLSECIQDLSSLHIDDFKKEEKLVSWKKVVSILKLFLSKNKEEDVKYACCRIFQLLVKYEYFDDTVRRECLMI